MLPLLAFLSVAEARCSLPRSLAELEAAVEVAEGAWGGAPAAFGEEMEVVGSVLACVNTPVPAPTAARLLRLDGLAAFSRRETERAAAAFAGARAVDPGITLPERMAAEGNPLRVVWDTLPAPDGASALRAPARGKLYVDGAATLNAPASRPFVFQAIDGVHASGAVATATTLPAYARAPHPARTPLVVTAAAAAVASGVLYGLSWDSHDRARDATTSEDFDAAEGENHALLIGSASAGGVAAVALGAAVVVWRW